MKRIIEILKEIEVNHDSIYMDYLVKKFSLTTRTLQKDIKIINKLLSNYGNYQIVFRKNKLIISEYDKIEKVIKKILSDLNVINNNFNLEKVYELILFFINNKNYTSYEKLLTFLKIDKYNLKQNIDLINNSFYYYSLNLRLTFKLKHGWMLNGNEIELRLLAQNILINKKIGPRYLKENNLNYLFNVIEEKLMERSFNKKYLINDLVYFLAILIKRIGSNNTLNKSYFNSIEINNIKSFETDSKDLVSLLANDFNINVNIYEIQYLNIILGLTHTNNKLELIEVINRTIKKLVVEKYGIYIKASNFQKNLMHFLTHNFFKIYCNFYSLLNFQVVVFPFPHPYQNLCDWEIIKIIEFVFKKFNLGNKIDLSSHANLLEMSSISLQINKINCKIPLFYIINDCDKWDYINKQIMLFIKNLYPCMYSSSLILKKLNYQLNSINKSFAIIIHNNPNIDWYKYENIYQIEFNPLKVNNNKLEHYINKHVNVINFKLFISKIFILGVFKNHNFSHFKNFLLVIQERIVKQFQLNTLYFQLETSFFDLNYINDGILLVQKVVPYNNIEIPVLLSYSKKPLIFDKKYQINYIIVLIMNSKSIHQNKCINIFLERFIKNKDIEFDSVKQLYEIIKNST